MRFSLIVAATTIALACVACGGNPEAAPSAAPETAQVPAATCQLPRPAPSGTTSQVIKVDGKTRSFVQHIPPSYKGTTAVPLVVDMHGLGQDGVRQAALSGFASVSDDNGFIVVEPDAINDEWELPTTPTATKDTRFIAALVDHLDKTLCLDKKRVYAAGMSLGSAMVFLEACLPKPIFAAFGGVGASFYRPACGSAPPAPIIYFHGTADKTVPFDGGKVNAGDLDIVVQPAPETMAEWAKHNECAASADQTQADVTLSVWEQCANNASINFYTVDGGGHSWPGTNPTIASFIESSVGKTTQTVNASEEMWAFFSNYSLS